MSIINKESLIPNHIAIIMDGNGRWAKSRGLKRTDGHKEGAKAVRKTVEACAKLGVRYLTLYSFSTENWNRDKEEVSDLMSLFKQYLQSELSTLLDNNIRLRIIGDTKKLPKAVSLVMNKVLDKTKNNNRMDLILALSYGSREEIMHACREISEKVKNGELSANEIDSDVIESHLWTSSIPNPDLLIRTSGEQRISNFLLWQLAYAEFVFTDIYWPEFNEHILVSCINEYNKRERRFGLTSEQIQAIQVNT